MAEVASAYVSLLPSAKGWEREVGRQIDGGTIKAGRTAGAKAGREFGGSFSGALKGVFAAAGGLALGGAALDFLKGSISEASDLNETVSKSNVIFGSSAKVIDRWARGAAGAIGLSHQAALESAASFGDMFNQIGIGGDRAAKMSRSVVQLAADLGSFNNLGTDDVLERIAGGFRGEYDALQKVIPNISAARVQQEALRRTHKKSVTDLTAAEKAEATLAIIRHDGARAAGDFARTSGGLANQQKILKARTDDLQAAIGKGLLPVTTEIVKKTSSFVEGMQDGTGAGGELVDVLKDTADVGKGVLAFFDAIPGPVKKYGAELLIAGVALNKVNDGLVAGRTAVSGWLASVGPAEQTMTRTAKASYALGTGLRNLAGAGGVLALADGATRGGDAVGYLETTLGGLATGFAVGGPVGAAVGGLAGGLFSVYKAATDAGDAAKDTGPDWKKYAETLDGVTAATSRQTRAMVLERLEKSGLLKQTQALNISDRDAVQATLGNEAARSRLSVALRKATDEGKNYEALQLARSLGLETTAIRDSRIAQLKKNLALAATKEEAQKIQAKLDRLAHTTANPTISIGGYAKATQQLNSVLTLMNEIGSSRGGVHGKTGGLDVLLNPKARARGGPIVPGETYLVGEHEPEIFTSSQRGYITPLSKVDRAQPTAGGRVTLTITNWHEGTGYIEAIADSRVDSAQAFDGMAERAFG